LSRTVPIAVIIPTYSRGLAVLSVLEKLQHCDPQPAETWIHIDLADGRLERELHDRFPQVRVLTSSVRLGPGGGRHRCLLACTTPYAVSFDDDSYPVDHDFFARIERLFSLHPRAAIFGANIWHRFEPAKVRTDNLVPSPSYIGCGYAIRLAAYKEVRGYLPRPVPYGMEESDLSLQLFAVGWRVFESHELLVFHDTELKHHQTSEVTAGTVVNVALYAFLNYPFSSWGLGLLQVANKIHFCIRMGRLRGILSGIVGIPRECFRFRQYRKPVDRGTLKKFIHFCRTGIAPACYR
jgi:GT2 family glycosyltransferase